MSRNEQLLPLRNFKGINRRDGGERPDILEFFTAQNLWQIDKGVWSMIYGSSYDLEASDVPGCRKITAIHRHTSAPCNRAVLYHCQPTDTKLTHPGSGGLTIVEITSGSGTIFDSISAAVSKKIWLCFTYLGKGIESSWDARARPGFTPYVAPTSQNAWDVGGLQSYTLAADTNTLNVSHPSSFPIDVRSVNVFMAMGDASDSAPDRRQFGYVGTLNSDQDVLSIDVSVGPRDSYDNAFTDANFQVEGRFDADGNLPAGQYFVALAWVAEAEPYDESIPGLFFTVLSAAKPVQLTGNANAIGINHFETLAKSADGATHCYAFIGVKSHTEGPMTCVGTFRVSSTAQSSGSIDRMVVKNIPYNTNASSYLDHFYNAPRMYAAENKTRTGFIVKKDPDRPVNVSEVFASRSYWSVAADPANSADYLYMQIRTIYDLYFNGTTPPSNPNIEDPSIVYFNGLSYLANGRDFLVTDGVSITRMQPKSSCVIPTAPKRLGVIKNQLVCTTAEEKGVIFASNALQGNNWSDGGTGAALRFLILGDPFEQRPASFGIFSFTSGTDGPRTLLITFKKNSTWSAQSVPDATAGVNGLADQMSGKVGNIAWRAITQTKIGMIFLGSDGNIYLIRGGGEPFPIGGRVEPLLKHLSKNDELMKMCTSVYHDGHWKLAYPSTPTSTYCDAEIWGDLRTEDGSPIVWYGPHVGREIGCQLVLDKEGDNDSRIGAMVSTAGTARLDDPSEYQNLGADITMILEWTLRTLSSEWNIKRWKGVFINAYYDSLYNQDLRVEGFADKIYTQTTHRLCAADENGEAAWMDHELYFSSDNLIGKRFKFKLTHTGRPLSLSAIALPWKPERRVSA